MTPLSSALRRIHGRSEASETAAGAVSQQAIPDATVVDVSESLATDVIAPAAGLVTQADTGILSATLPVTAEPDDTPATLPFPKPTQPRGRVDLLADLTGDGELAFQIAAERADLVLVLQPGAAPTGPLAMARVSQVDLLQELTWPVPGKSTITPWQAATPRVELPMGSAGMDARRWVLFLDQCRQRYDMVRVVIPVACTRELAWLASRCDRCSVVALAGVSTASAARIAALRLGQVAHASPTCLLVERTAA